MNQQKELGIIFIVNFPFNGYNDENDPEGIQDSIKSLATGFFNFEKYIHCPQAEIYFITCFPGDKEFEKSPNTKVTRLTFGEETQKYKTDSIVNFGVVNLGNKDVLSAILIYIVREMKAKKHVLFFYNHSSNFGLFNNTADSASNVRGPGLIIETVRNIAAENFLAVTNEIGFGLETAPVLAQMENFKEEITATLKNFNLEFSQDFKDDMLTNAELHIAIFRALKLNNETYNDKDKPIEVIFSAGCFFQNIDMAYTLKDFANYLVGAQGIMPPQSYQYPDIINAIFAQLNEKGDVRKVDFKAIIADILRDFGKPYEESQNEHIRGWLQYSTISAIDCSRVNELKLLLDEFVMYCFTHREMIRKIRIARGSLIDISLQYPQEVKPNLNLFDWRNLIHGLRKQEDAESIPPELKDIYDRIEKTLNLMMPITGFPAQLEEKTDCRGISLYFPGRLAAALETYNFTNFYSPTSRMESFFAKDSLWQEFLFFYYKMIDRQ